MSSASVPTNRKGTRPPEARKLVSAAETVAEGLMQLLGKRAPKKAQNLAHAVSRQDGMPVASPSLIQRM
jgi:hypothetical protein